MAGVKVNFSVDSSQVNKGINDVKNGIKSVKNGSSNAAQAMDKFGDAADGAVRAVDSVGGACGLASTGISGLAGDLIYLVKNPIAMAIAAVAALVAAITSLYDNMTQNGEQFGKQVQLQSRLFQMKTAKMQKALSQEQKYFDRLKDLQKLQTLTNSERNEAAAILDILSRKYGDLGISIDKVANKLSGANAAQAQFLQTQLAKKLQNHRQAIKVKQSEVEAAMVKDVKNEGGATFDPGHNTLDLIGGMGITAFYAQLLDTDEFLQEGLKDYEFSDYSERRFAGIQTQSEANKKKMARLVEKWNTKDTKKRLEVLRQIVKSGPIRSNASYQEAINEVILKYQQLADLQDGLKDLQRDMQMTRKAGASARDRQMLQWRKQENAKVEEETRTINKQGQSNFKAQHDSHNRLMEFRRNQRYNNMTADEKIKYHDDEVQFERKLQGYYKEDTEKAVNKLDQYKKQLEQKQSVYKNLKTEQQRVRYKKRIVDVERQIAIWQSTRLSLSDDLNKSLLREQQHLQTKIDLEKEQLALEKQRKKEIFQDSADTLKNNFFSKFGDGSNLVTAAQKIVQAQLKLGRSLTQTEKDQLLKVEQIEKAMADLGSLGLDKIIGIQTNALTSRGGWAGGVRNMASQVQINKRIADYSGKQVMLLQQIKKVVQNAGRI